MCKRLGPVRVTRSNYPLLLLLSLYDTFPPTTETVNFVCVCVCVVLWEFVRVRASACVCVRARAFVLYALNFENMYI